VIKALFMQISDSEIEQIIMNLGFKYQVAVVVALVMGFVAVAIGAAWLIREKWFTPLESKEIRSAFRKKTPILFLGGDDGYGDFLPAVKSGSEGILETKSKGKSKDHYTGALPRPREFREDEIAMRLLEGGLTESEAEKKVKGTTNVANALSQFANRRLILRGSRIPLWIGYRGKAVLASLYGLVALQIVEGLSKLDALKEAFATVDLLLLKELFSEQWNLSQIIAQETDKERGGELKARRFQGKDTLILLFAVMIFLVIAVILLLVVAYYFK
jgi:hypothetical protein